MPDVPFAVAVLAAAAPIVAGAIPLIVSAIQGRGKDKRDRQERAQLDRRRSLEERRKDCAVLLQTARDFRVAVDNYFEYSGVDKLARAWDIRQRAANITGQADEIGLALPQLATPADAVADAANLLVGIVADPQTLALRASTQRPDTTGLERCIKEFKSAAQAALYDGPALRDTSLMPGQLDRGITMGG